MTRRAFLRSSGRAIAGGAMVLAVPDVLRSAVRPAGEYLERAVYAMGTTVSISAFGQDRGQILAATSAAFEELYRLERLLSVFRPDSDIGRLNASAGNGIIDVHDETYEVLSLAKQFHRRTRGAFDITVEPLMRRWGFRSEPDCSRDESLTVGDDHLHLGEHGSIWIDHPGVNVDTGGIAVGYAVDRMVSILREKGISRALVNHGGDIYAMGAPEGSEGWRVIIPHPQEERPDLFTLTIRDRALSTSTNTRNIRQRGSQIVGHIFDPASGRNPLTCLSMTVLSSNACEADALSTACFVAGRADAALASGCDHITLAPGERFESSLR